MFVANHGLWNVISSICQNYSLQSTLLIVYFPAQLLLYNLTDLEEATEPLICKLNIWDGKFNNISLVP